MTNIQFDHFITFTSAINIDDYLEEYAAQGFVPEEKTVRHDPGLRNGFIFIGPEYGDLTTIFITVKIPEPFIGRIHCIPESIRGIVMGIHGDPRDDLLLEDVTRDAG